MLFIFFHLPIYIIVVFGNASACCMFQTGFDLLVLSFQITKEQVALKRCRLDLNSRNRKRWQQEVDIMKRLDHPNLVSARDVPPPLDVKDDELPLLAMEFCSGGDLRKVKFKLVFPSFQLQVLSKGCFVDLGMWWQLANLYRTFFANSV